MTGLIEEDLCFWEAEYEDGTVLKEASGFAYGNLPRSGLKRFNLVYEGEIVFGLTIPPHMSGQNLVYRRRTSLGGGRSIFFLLGFIPDGPAFAVDISRGDFRVSEEGFIRGDPDFYPPAPMPGELNFTSWEREPTITKY